MNFKATHNLKKLLLLGAVACCVLSGLQAASLNQKMTHLALLQERQNEAISKARFSVVTVIARHNTLGGPQNVGSGVIVSHECHVITNSHVVTGFDEITVSFLQGGGTINRTAKIVDNNAENDLAIIKVLGQTDCIPAVLSSHHVNIGDSIFVIGSPYAYSHTVTKGIVSKVQRKLLLEGKSYHNMIQTDASINQGNSGGPLININGEVVGIATAIFTKSAGNNGVGFAVPSPVVRSYMDSKLPLGLAGKDPIKAPHNYGRAMRVVVPAKKERINLTAPVPHAFLGDCTKCHTLAFKTPITPGAPMPHPAMGICTKCHIITTAKTGKTVAVAATGSFMSPPKPRMKKKAFLHKKPAPVGQEKTMQDLLLYILVMMIVMYLVWIVYRNLNEVSRKIGY